MKSSPFDVIIIGAGAAGMFAAFTAGQRGRRVLLIDHSSKIGEKIRISGGGRCNFTNLHASPAQYLSQNPHFCRSALARYTPQDFLKLLQQHSIRYHEKTLGQLFCDDSAQQIIDMLVSECRDGDVQWSTGTTVNHIEQAPTGRFHLQTSRGLFDTESLIIATGGLSIPQIGATGFGYDVARQFGLRMVEPSPGLVPLAFPAPDWQQYADLSGLSVDAEVSCQKTQFREAILITHKGISGPAILQISSFWKPGQMLSIDLAPHDDLRSRLQERAHSEQLLSNALAEWLPKRFAQLWCDERGINLPLKQLGSKALEKIGEELHHWLVRPAGTVGYKKAEVTLGGVDTRDLSSKTMMANDVPGLFFIGEVVDVTGWLGGYNFQWAWASAHAAGSVA
ncbi:NAD(P)/FAD-dependent oxidoreductase [Permianibacter sp. IMCC34836]|uniref:NAD(P)/FAD-dependent oxidoreductase n=1 Tax=Permianibacter fluminis TaxID=2738515 RepID=UPI0015575941|nr:NAD(P)/FAD-dependent oxidoreductase [Permianibacter fluminis]NQD37160.1 NAD(P)/FAD-dependent oxidoreductase [Permianibacter fluminis]